MDSKDHYFSSWTPEMENMQKDKNGCADKGGDAMVIFDYNEKNTETRHITIEEDTLCCMGAEVYHVTFRNFPVLRIDKLRLYDCRFQNCRIVHFTECEVDDCRFDGIETLYADDASLSGCAFEHLRCDNDCILCLEDTQISFCSFQDVELTNGSYLTSGVGDSWIESCRFEDIRTDREDRTIIFCEEIVGGFIKKKKQFCIVDEESCPGLNKVRYTAKAEEPMDEEAKILRWAVERGLLSAVVAAGLPGSSACDVSQWDPQYLAKPIGNLISSVQGYNCLTRAGLKTIEDLVSLNEIQILKIRNIGRLTILCVREMLHNQGIHGSAWDTFCRSR